MSEMNNENETPNVSETQNRFSRREFLKGAAAVAAGAALGETAVNDAAASPGYKPPEILIRYGDEDSTDSQQKEMSGKAEASADKVNKIREKLKFFKRNG